MYSLKNTDHSFLYHHPFIQSFSFNISPKKWNKVMK